MKELTDVLVKHYNLPEGKYDLEVEFQIGTGPVGPNKNDLIPGVILGVKSIGIGTAQEVDEQSSEADIAAESGQTLPAKTGRRARKPEKR
jgi:hypothetical protein